AEIGLDVEVLVDGLSAGEATGDVRDGGRWGDGHRVRVPNPVRLDVLVHRRPVQPALPRHLERQPTFPLQERERVVWKETAIPLRARVGLVAASLPGRLGRGE